MFSWVDIKPLLSKEINISLDDLGFKNPTPIQVDIEFIFNMYIELRLVFPWVSRMLHLCPSDSTGSSLEVDILRTFTLAIHMLVNNSLTILHIPWKSWVKK